MSSRGSEKTIPLWEKAGFDNPDDYCVDLVSAIDVHFFFAPLKNTNHHFTHNQLLIKIMAASTAMQKSQPQNRRGNRVDKLIVSYQACWQRVKRRKNKEGGVQKTPPPTSVVAADHSPISDVSTTSSTTSTKSKSINGRIVRQKRKEIMRTSLDSAARWIDRKSTEAALIKRPRRTSKQANQDRFEEKAVKKHHDDRYKDALKKASTELHNNNNSENKGKQGYGARAVAEKYNAIFLNEDGDKQISKSTLINYATNELAGKSPAKMGRPSVVPSPLKRGLVTHAVMMQVSGTEGEASTARLKEVATAAVSGTQWEGRFDIDYAVRKAVEDYPAELQPVSAKNNEDARVEWLTYGNINEWTDHLKDYLCNKVGFAKDEPGLICKCT